MSTQLFWTVVLAVFVALTAYRILDAVVSALFNNVGKLDHILEDRLEEISVKLDLMDAKLMDCTEEDLLS